LQTTTLVAQEKLQKTVIFFFIASSVGMGSEQWVDAYKDGVERASLNSRRGCLDGIAVHWIADPCHNATFLSHSSNEKW
jgi:hypothetical protein